MFLNCTLPPAGLATTDRGRTSANRERHVSLATTIFKLKINILNYVSDIPRAQFCEWPLYMVCLKIANLTTPLPKQCTLNSNLWAVTFLLTTAARPSPCLKDAIVSQKQRTDSAEALARENKKLKGNSKSGEKRMDWDCGFSTSSYQQFMLDEGEMEEFRSEKSVKAGKVKKY